MAAARRCCAVATLTAQHELVGHLERLAQRKDDLRGQLHCLSTEDVTVVMVRLVLFCDVGKVSQVLGILAGTVDIPNLMFTHRALGDSIDKLDSTV